LGWVVFVGGVLVVGFGFGGGGGWVWGGVCVYVLLCCDAWHALGSRLS